MKCASLLFRLRSLSLSPSLHSNLRSCWLVLAVLTPNRPLHHAPSCRPTRRKSLREPTMDGRPATRRTSFRMARSGIYLGWRIELGAHSLRPQALLSRGQLDSDFRIGGSSDLCGIGMEWRFFPSVCVFGWWRAGENEEGELCCVRLQPVVRGT